MQNGPISIWDERSGDDDYGQMLKGPTQSEYKSARIAEKFPGRFVPNGMIKLDLKIGQNDPDDGEAGKWGEISQIKKSESRQ